MARPRTAAIVVALVVAASIGSFAVGSRIASPAEVAARTAPPEPSLILVPVETRRLTADVVTRGTGRYGSPVKVSVATSALKPNPGRVGDVPIVGTVLREGMAVLGGLGRPLLLLQGDAQLSRDLGPGMEGSDVRQLEEALDRLGFDPGVVDGRFDERTGAAVSAWYTANGFAPFTATADQLGSIRSREAALATARVDVVVASDAAASSDGARAGAIATHDAALSRAQAARLTLIRVQEEVAKADEIATADLLAREAGLDALRSGATSRPATAAEIAVGEADLAASVASQTSVRHAGRRDVAEAQAALERAAGRLESAIGAAGAANAAAAADIEAKRAALASAGMFVVVGDGLVIDSSKVPAQIAQAQADLAAVQATAEQVRVTHDQAIADVRTALDQAPGLLDGVLARTTAADIAAARDVASKEAALHRLMSPIPASSHEIAVVEREVTMAALHRDRVRLSGERAVHDAMVVIEEATADVSAKRLAVRAAGTAVSGARRLIAERVVGRDLATRDVELARRQAGVQVPADEVVFVPSGEVRVSKVLVGAGDPIAGAILFVSDSLVYVDAALAVRDATMVRPGMAVRIAEPDLAIAVEGTVRTVASTPGTNGVDGFHVYAEIAVDAPPTNLVGSSVRLTIPVESTDGEVLTVPVSALTMGPDGTSRVQLRVGVVSQFVAVAPGLSAHGFVAVTPIGAALNPGDLVVAGIKQPGVPRA